MKTIKNIAKPIGIFFLAAIGGWPLAFILFIVALYFYYKEKKQHVNKETIA